SGDQGDRNMNLDRLNPLPPPAGTSSRTGRIPFAQLLLVLGTASSLLLGAGCSSSPEGLDAGADMGGTPPADLSPGGNDAGAPDMSLPVPIPRYSVGGSVNAVLHVDRSWYIGGAFTRISQFAATNLIPL